MTPHQTPMYDVHFVGSTLIEPAHQPGNVCPGKAYSRQVTVPSSNSIPYYYAVRYHYWSVSSLCFVSCFFCLGPFFYVNSRYWFISFSCFACFTRLLLFHGIKLPWASGQLPIDTQIVEELRSTGLFHDLRVDQDEVLVGWHLNIEVTIPPAMSTCLSTSPLSIVNCSGGCKSHS